MNSEKPFVIYSRKSKYTGKGESIGNQIEMCRDYIRLHFGEKEAEQAVVYEDEGFSGGNLARPQFQAMMEEVRQGSYRAVVVYRLDRVSRNIGDFAGLIRELEGCQIDFISIKEQFDTGSPMGRAMMYISSVFSQLERETIAERIRDNLHELAKTGRWLGGNTPTGYKSRDVVSLTIDGKQKKAYMLEEIPKELEMVELLYSKFLELQALSKLDAFLLRNDFRTKNGNDFSRFAIRDILTNPVYMIADEDAWRYFAERGIPVFAGKEDFDGVHGIMAYNRTLQKRGKAHRDNPVDQWIVSVGKHKGRIPGAEWVRVQKILERNRSKEYRKPRSSEALLSGILRCGGCGDYMRPKKGRIHKDGECPYFYLCTRKERSQKSRCAMKNLNGREADRLVIESLGSLEEDREAFIRELEKGKRSLRERVGRERAGWERADREKADQGKENREREGREKEGRERETKEKTGREAKWGEGGNPAGEYPDREENIRINEEKIRRLVDTLSLAPKGTEIYILEQIEKISKENEQLKLWLEEKADPENQRQAEGQCRDAGQTETKKMETEQIETERLVQTALSLKHMAEQMGTEQRRDMVRDLVKAVFWDGEEIHVALVGSEWEYGRLPL